MIVRLHGGPSDGLEMEDINDDAIMAGLKVVDPRREPSAADLKPQQLAAVAPDVYWSLYQVAMDQTYIRDREKPAGKRLQGVYDFNWVGR